MDFNRLRLFGQLGTEHGDDYVPPVFRLVRRLGLGVGVEDISSEKGVLTFEGRSAEILADAVNIYATQLGEVLQEPDGTVSGLAPQLVNGYNMHHRFSIIPPDPNRRWLYYPNISRALENYRKRHITTSNANVELASDTSRLVLKQLYNDINDLEIIDDLLTVFQYDPNQSSDGAQPNYGS